MEKVFCIGFQKTGTTSLGKALEILGYRVCGPVGVTNPEIGARALDWAFDKIPYYDAFEDNPWPLLYRELDQACPGSKFILTTRRPRSWIRSMRKYFGDYEAAAEAWIYGDGVTPLRHPRKCLRRYRQHNQDVRAYFAGRPHDLLEIDFGQGHGWAEICGFLNVPAPDAPFPFSNKSGSLEAEVQRHAVGLFGTARTHIHRGVMQAQSAVLDLARTKLNL